MATLPTVSWGEFTLSRLLIGHNPLKGQSHHTRELDAEMAEWYAPEAGHDVEVLERCEAEGINTAQFGAPNMHSVLRRHKEGGGTMQWIATFYDGEGGDPVAELDAILAVDPKPIGLYYYGGRLDQLFLQKRMQDADENLKRLRDTGILVGAGSHLPETFAEIESRGWDVDFYEACVYSVYADRTTGRIDRDNEVFDDVDREKMFEFIRGASKPCIAFKVLAANRKCETDEGVRAALEHAYASIKDTDVVLAGMWQKHKDQVGQNAAWVREILG